MLDSADYGQYASSYDKDNISKSRFNEIFELAINVYHVANKFITKGVNEYTEVYESDEISPPYESSITDHTIDEMFSNMFIFRIFSDMEINRTEEFREPEEGEDDDEYSRERDEFDENADYTVSVSIKFDADEENAEKRHKDIEERKAKKEAERIKEEKKEKKREARLGRRKERRQIRATVEHSNYVEGIRKGRAFFKLAELEKAKMDIEEQISIATINDHIASSSRDVVAIIGKKKIETMEKSKNLR